MQAIAAGLLVGESVAFHSLHRAIHESSVSTTALFATVHVETTTGSANPMGPKVFWQRGLGLLATLQSCSVRCCLLVPNNIVEKGASN